MSDKNNMYWVYTRDAWAPFNTYSPPPSLWVRVKRRLRRLWSTRRGGLDW